MANNIFNNFNISYNSIADQKLTAANTLTVKAWNDIITILKTQANINATYLNSLNEWLIGKDPVSIPGENSFVDYINTYIGEMPNTVMDIVHKNSLGFTTIDIGYSTNYNIESDKELPTTKTVNKMLDGPRNSIKDINEALEYKADLVDGKVPLEQLDTKETGELLVGTSANYDTSRDDQIPTTKAVDAMVNELKNSVDTKLDAKADLVDGKVPASQLPGYVDDVIEVDNFGDLPIPGESGKVYIVKSTNITYRWSGTQYTVIGKDLALGETSSTAFPGDRGKALELNTVKKTTENVSSTPLSQIKQLYGDAVAARVSDEYVLLVFGTTIENNACSLTIYDKGSIKQFNNIWLNYTLGQVLHMGPNYMNSYTDTQIDELISASPMSTYEVDLTEASWVRLAKVKDLTKNSSGQFIFDCYGRKANEEGTVLENIIGTTPKPNRKYELEMDVTLRELYNRFNATMPFEIKLNTSYDSTKTALYFGADGHGTNSNIINNPGPYNNDKETIDDFALLGSVYAFDNIFNEELQTYTYILANNNTQGGLSAFHRKINYTEINEDHFRLIVTGTSYSEDGSQQQSLIPPYTLYRNGIEIFKNERYIENARIITLEERNACSIALDNFTTEDVFTIEYSQYPAYGVNVVHVNLFAIYDIDSTILTMKGFIEGTDESIQSVESTYPITKITEYESHQEILTTSVFNVTCGLDDNGKLITDVLPITQSPELSGSDSSGGGSSGGGGSGGSGLTGTNGLASILLENYEGETYVCGLINFPNTGNYLGTYIEMKIENNLNFETLNRLEVVDIEEKQNTGEFQLLEGTKFENDLKYDFKLYTTLENLKENVGVRHSFLFNIGEDAAHQIIVSSFVEGETILKTNTKDYPFNGTYIDTANILSYFINREIITIEPWFNTSIDEDFKTSENNLYEAILNSNYKNYNEVTLVKDIFKTTIKKFNSISGTLRVFKDVPLAGPDYIYVNVTLNGVNKVYYFSDGYVDIPINNLTEATGGLQLSGNVRSDVSFTLDIMNSDVELEIAVSNFIVEKDFELGFYNIPGDFSVFGISYKFHKTSDSYDLFSVYNKLEEIDKFPQKINSLKDELKQKMSTLSINANDSYFIDLIKFICREASASDFTNGIITVNLFGNNQHAYASGYFGAITDIYFEHLGISYQGFEHIDFILNLIDTNSYQHITDAKPGLYRITGTYIRGDEYLSALKYNRIDNNILYVTESALDSIVRTIIVKLLSELNEHDRQIEVIIEQYRSLDTHLIIYPPYVPNATKPNAYFVYAKISNHTSDDISIDVTLNPIGENKKYRYYNTPSIEDVSEWGSLIEWVNNEDLSTHIQEYDLSGSADTYTKTETDDKLNLKADKADTYNKTEVNTKLDAKADLVDGKVPASQLPSYVDDVLEYNTFGVLPSAGESGKIYVTTYDNKTYRWSGSQYVEIGQSLALGETSSTAYAGDKGKANADAIVALQTEVGSIKEYVDNKVPGENAVTIPLSTITTDTVNSSNYKKIIGRIFWYIFRNYIMDTNTMWLINEHTPLNYKVTSTNAIGEITYEVSITNVTKYASAYPDYDGYITIKDISSNKIHVWHWDATGSGDSLSFTTLTLNATDTSGTLFSVSRGDIYKLEYNTTGVSVYYENKKTIELDAEFGKLILGAPGEEVYLDCAGIEHNGGFLSYTNIANKNYVTTTAYTKDEMNNKLTNKADLVDGKVPASQLPSDTSNNMIFVEPSEIITLVPNQYHILDAQVPSNITLTLQDYDSDETFVYREYMGEIRVDEHTITAAVPEGIRWNETDGATIEGTTLTLEGKRTYLFSILNYIGLISSIANPQLDAPVLTLEGSVLSWDAINNAKTYRVYTPDNDLSTLSTTQIDLQNYITNPGVYTVYVEAKDNYYTDNVNSIEYVISTTLAAPTNLVINESNTLSWDSVENASSYLVTLKETSSTKTVTTNLCDLTTFTELSTAGTYTFEVNAVGDNKVYLTSSASATITVTIPEA